MRGVQVQPAPLRRPRSESELSLIDRRATFADTGGPSELDPAELLHEFMSALVPDEPFPGWRPAAPPAYAAHAGTPMPDGGIMGFSDHDIMADEGPRMKLRGRAASLAPRMVPEEEGEQEQWTWSGAAASKRIQDLLRARNIRLVKQPFTPTGVHCEIGNLLSLYIFQLGMQFRRSIIHPQQYETSVLPTSGPNALIPTNHTTIFNQNCILMIYMIAARNLYSLSKSTGISNIFFFF